VQEISCKKYLKKYTRCTFHHIAGAAI